MPVGVARRKRRGLIERDQLMTEAKRFGAAALVGRPNAGKSTLLNALLGDKVAIVSDKPQTTRNRIVGILNHERGQVVIFDLPGVHKPLHKMNRRMMQEVRSSLAEVDVVLHLVDSSVEWGGGEDFLFGLLKPAACRVLGVLTKVDLVRPKDRLLPLIEEYDRRRPRSTVVPTSAVTGEGLENLVEELFAALPEGPPMYPEDLATTQTERFYVAELVREKLLRHLRSELPYSSGVVVDFMEESDALLRISAVIYVERPSQKGIVIGRGGGMIKAVGSEAREELEKLFGTRIYLDLRVKVHPRWRDDARVLMQMEPGMADLAEGDG